MPLRIRTTQELKQVLEQKLTDLKAALQADNATLHLYDPHRDRLYFPVGVNLLHERRFIQGVPNMDRVAGKVVRTQSPVIAHDAEQHPDLTGPFTHMEKVKSAAGFPLVAPDSGEMMGVLFVNYRHPYRFEAECVEQIENRALEIAEIVSQSLKGDQGQALRHALRTETDFRLEEARQQEVITRLWNILGDVDVALWARERGGQDMRIKIHAGMERSFVDNVLVNPDIHGSNLVSVAFAQGKEVLIESPLTDPGAVFNVASPVTWGYMLAVPVSSKQHRLGVLCVFRREPIGFTPRERDLIRGFASLTAVTIENEERIIALNTLHDVGVRLTRATDLRDILQEVVRSAYQVIGADIATAHLYNPAQQEFYDLERSAVYPPEARAGMEKPRSRGGLGAQVLEQGRVICEDIETQADESTLSRYVKEQGIRAYVGTRLISLDEPLGVLYVSFKEQHPFSADEFALIQILANYASTAVYRAELLDQRAAVTEIAREISSKVELDELLQTILEQSLRLLKCRQGSIALFDKHTNELVFQYAMGKQRWTRLRLGEGLMGTCARLSEPVRVGDVAKDSRYVRHVEETRSELDVPMLMGDELVGVLNAESPQYDAFSEEDERLATALASQAAVALHNAALFGQIGALVDFGQAVTSHIRLQEAEILGLVHKQASQLMDTDNMYIALYDEPTDTVRFGLAFVEGRRVDVEMGQGWQPRRAGKGKTEEIIRTREPLFHATKEEAEEWYALPDHKEYVGGALPSWLGVPMMVGERVLGVIAVYHPDQDYVYSGEDLDILQAMANQAAIALDNAHLFFNVNQKLKALVQFGQAVTSHIRLQEAEILGLVHEQASQLMDTDNMYIALYDEPTDTVRFGLAFVEGRRVDVEMEQGWQPRRAGKGKTEEIIRTREPLFHATEAEAKEWYALPGHEEYIGAYLASWLGVPMMVGERVLGVIAVYHPDRDYVYSGEDLDILQAMANQAAIALDSSRVLNRLETLIEFTQEVTSGTHLREQRFLTEKQVLELIYRQASPLMDTDNMSIALYDEATDTVRFGLAMRHGKQIDVEKEPGWGLRPGLAGKGKTNEVIRTKKSILLSSLEEEHSWYAQQGRERYIEEPRASWLGVPMMIGERIVGVIDIYHLEKECVYGGDDLDILQAIGHQAAIALDNVASYTQAEKRRSQLETARDVANAIVTEIDPQACMDRILDMTMELLGTHYATIQLVEEGTDELVIRAQRGLEGKELDPDLHRIKIGTGVTGVAAQEKRTIRIGNVEDVEYYLGYLEDTRSEMATPLIEHGTIIGVLNVEDPRENAFDSDDEALFKLLAEQVVIAVQNATRLDADRREQKRRAEAEKLEYLGLLAGGVAHRVGSKGGLVRLHVNNLRKLIPPDNSDAHAILDKIKRDNEYLIRLSDALFKPAYAAETPVGLVNVNQLIREAIRRTAIPRDVELDFLEGDVPQVNGNRWLVEVFLELMSNAIRAMKACDEKKLNIRSEPADGDRVAVICEDTGCGIDPAGLRQIFDLFYTRGKDEEAPNRGGYGLWYCKSIVTKMGGDLQIQSEVGKGTKCMVLLATTPLQ